MPAGPTSAALMRVLPDDPAYRRMAAAEAAFWRAVHPCGLESLEQREPQSGIDRYVNERFTGRAGVAWEETIAHHGAFRRGLMLGTSAITMEARILETNPSLHLTFLDLRDGPLVRRWEQLGGRFPGRVDTQTADLNFLVIPEQTYDVVVSSGTIHHVTNLEYLADQINRGLTRPGWFFYQDSIGEPRLDVTARKRRLFEVLYDHELARQTGRRPGLVWSDASDLSPFCGLRSDEILAVMRAHLREVELRTASTLLVPLMRVQPADGVS